MLNELAKAIVSGLIAGAKASGSQIVADTYDAAQALLKRLVPRFDPTSISHDQEIVAVEVLENRLRSNTHEEIAELAAAFSKLAEAVGAVEDKLVFDRVVEVYDVSAAKDVNIEVETGSSSHDKFSSVSSKNGSVRIKTRQVIKGR